MNNRTGSEPVRRPRERALGQAPGVDSAAVVAMVLWVVVGFGLLYGVWETVTKVSALFS